MYFRSLYTCRFQLESTSSILLLSSSNRITLCTVGGVLAWSHKRDLVLVSQYGQMTSSCLFFSLFYISTIWPTCQVDQPHSQTTDSILGEELFLPLTEISLGLSGGPVIKTAHIHCWSSSALPGGELKFQMPGLTPLAGLPGGCSAGRGATAGLSGKRSQRGPPACASEGQRTFAFAGERDPAEGLSLFFDSLFFLCSLVKSLLTLSFQKIKPNFVKYFSVIFSVNLSFIYALPFVISSFC